jgi:hypothetical protein
MSQMMSPERFVDEFAPALQEYLEYQYRNEGHILDMIAAAGEYFTVSFSSASAVLNAVQYTETTSSKGDVPQKKKRKN